MQSLTALRVFSTLATLAALLCLNSNSFHFIVAVVGLGHYALSVWYSRNVLQEVRNNRAGFIGFFLALLLFAACLRFEWPGLILLFGIHHLFNEVYLPSAYYPAATSNADATLGGLRFIFHSLVYYIVIFSVQAFAVRALAPHLTVLALCTLVYFWTINHREKNPRIRRDLLLSELVILAFVGLTFMHPLGFFGILFFHFVFWIFFPLVRIKKRGAVAVRNYFVQTIVVTAIIACVLYHFDEPYFGRLFFDRNSAAVKWLRLAGYFHIITSFSLSAMNPRIVRKLFAIRRTA